MYLLFFFFRMFIRQRDLMNALDLLEGKSREEFIKSLDIDASVLSESMTKELEAARGDHFVPVAAIVGGVVAQYLLKGVAQKDEPLHNFFTYNAEDHSGMTMQLV